jgi:CubicO group peptidase (beta-lactamase class C family)
VDPLELLTRAPLRFLSRCRVPRDLASVTRVGHEESLEGTGVDRVAIDEVWSAAEALYRTGVTPALQLCIRRRSRIVLNRALGHARGNAPEDPEDAPKVAATPETPINVFSTAKLVTAMVIHKLDEQGVLHLEDRVCEYIPEFARHGKQWITLRHILSHRSGIPNLPPEALDLDLLDEPDRICELLCDMKRSARPGRLVAYHAISGGFVLAEVVRRAAGRTIRDVLRTEIREPLGVRWLHYGVAPEDVDRVAPNAFTGPPPPPPLRRLLARALGRPLREIVSLSNDPRFLTGIIPSGNVISTAEDFSAFLQCMLQEGRYRDTRIFEPRTIRHALGEASYREIDLTLMMPLRYGLGPMLGDDPIGIFGPHTARAFGHVGLSNIFPWADPEREISVALFTTGKPILSAHALRLVKLLTTINRVFPKTGASAAAAGAPADADFGQAASR